MATSSITKNFVISGKQQAERFADAIEASYQESLTRDKNTAPIRYRELKDPVEIQKLMEK